MRLEDTDGEVLSLQTLPQLPSVPSWGGARGHPWAGLRLGGWYSHGPDGHKWILVPSPDTNISSALSSL